ncbi:phage scaffolding protein [Paenibacillus popilliae]|uniref:Uncharacterized protein n=1 Tax=Paenibacillus popilliae ATCC 14706 TaxID=1212764 RepID=M9L966_PAEPP|nr:phage scaffolding protein [Paenibacillus popilliae]GAC41897.1 hypothetical protein PPOP_1254 [Paenibacillus popilliae ATCC 14706]
MIAESIKKLLGEELSKQVEGALKGTGKEGKDVDLVVGNDGSFVPTEKYDAANKGKVSAETALKSAAEALKTVGGSGDPAKIADDVKAAQSKIDELGKAHKAELLKIQRTSAIKTALAGKVHDADDIIKLLDMDKIEVDDSGSLKTNIDDLVKSVKETKPYLFISEKPETTLDVTGAKPAVPGTTQPTQKDPSQMTYTELAAYMASNPGIEI